VVWVLVTWEGRPTKNPIHLRAIPKPIEQSQVDEDRGYDYDCPSDGYREIAGVECVGEGWEFGCHLDRASASERNVERRETRTYVRWATSRRRLLSTRLFMRGIE
jgi:hypothetical protein